MSFKDDSETSTRPERICCLNSVRLVSLAASLHMHHGMNKPGRVVGYVRQVMSTNHNVNPCSNLRFRRFILSLVQTDVRMDIGNTNGHMDRRTGIRTDKPSCKDARTHLKCKTIALSYKKVHLQSLSRMFQNLPNQCLL